MKHAHCAWGPGRESKDESRYMMSEVGPDQKPLIPIHKKSLLNTPKRLQRMLLGALKYDYEVVYKKGTDMFVADTLSRALEKNSTGRMKTEKEEIFQTDD